MISHFIDQFKTIYEGEPWFGESFKEKLKDVTEEQAFTRPAPDIHCMAELLSHCIYWRTPLIKKLEKDNSYKASMKSEDNWLSFEKLKAKGWNSLINEWDASQARLIQLLGQAPESFLSEVYRGEHKMNHLLEGIVQHDIYHLGQIGMVKKWLERSAPKNRPQ